MVLRLIIRSQAVFTKTITMVQEMTMMQVLADTFTFWNILNICNNIQNIHNNMPEKDARSLPSLEVEDEALTSRLSILRPALSSALDGSARHTG